MKIAYIEKTFQTATMEIVNQANRIITEYETQGFTLTLRQLYYQFVARDLIENTVRSYKRLGNIVSDARLTGLIDWDAIEDRTRNLTSPSFWSSPISIVRSAERGYRRDLWEGQKHRPEVWIEKDALVGVFAGICDELDVPYFACRGYNSQSEMWGAGQRFVEYLDRGQAPVVFHFGDHDPSGLDMTRDTEDRLTLFMNQYADIRRLALNWAQVEEYGPPPNPTKLTDSRATVYIADYGPASWELDAMEPAVLVGLVRSAILSIRDEDVYAEVVERQEDEREELAAVRRNWADVQLFLNGNHAE